MCHICYIVRDIPRKDDVWSVDVVAPTGEQKAENKHKINEMKEQAKNQKAIDSEDPKWG